MSIDLSTIVRQAKEQISCTLNNEVAILNTNSNIYFSLDEVGGVIWQEIAERRTVKDICRAVVRQFDVPEDQCESDVIEFLDRLLEARLIEAFVSDGESGSQ